MSYIDESQVLSTGLSPSGDTVSIPVQGTKALTNISLLEGGTWSSGWLAREYYTGAQTTIYSNVDGTYLVEYSDDEGISLSMPSVPVTYLHTQGTRKGAFDIGATWVRFSFTNGSSPQTKFKFEIRFLTGPAQVSTETLNAIGADSRFAQWTKSRIETKDSNNGTYAPVYRTGNSLNVQLKNADPIAVSIVGMESGDAPNGMVTVANFPTSLQVSNFPEQIFPSSFEVSNFPQSFDITTVSPIDVNIISETLNVTGDFFPDIQPVSGSLQVDNFPEVQTIQGDITVSNFPVIQPVSGNVSISGTPDVNVSFPASQTINGSVSISGTPTVNIGTLPSIEISNDSGNPIAISGSVTANVTFPVTQAVSGSVSVSNSLDITDRAIRQLGHVSVDNFPSSQNVVVSSLPVITGSVNITNTSLAVTGAFYQATQPVSLATNTPDITDRSTRLLGHTTVDNFPASQNVVVTSIPNINISNFPSTQAVSASSLPLPSGASTSANQTAANTSLASIDSKLTSPITVTGTITSTPTAFTPKSYNYGTSGTSTGVQTLKTGAGIIGLTCILNETSNDIFIQFFDVASGTGVALGTTVPTFVYAVDSVAPFTEKIDYAFTNGLKFAITTTYSGSAIVTQVYPTINIK